MLIKKIISFWLYCLVVAFVSFSIKAAEFQHKPTQFVNTSYITGDINNDGYSDDLWGRIRQGFGFDDLDSAAIRMIERSYARSPKNLYRIAERSRRYLFYIVDEIARRGLPTELALLPIVESAFKPNARSKQNAVGLWQFISSTGKMYGLKQNRWHDDRKDVVAATHAALDYLENLYRLFGDWKLVIAAYNWGDGAVKRMLARHRRAGRSTEFKRLKLPRETRNHVNKLIAIKNIIANPDDYGIQFPEISNQPYFGKVETKKHISIKLITKFAGISLAEFKALNPAYKKSIVRVTGASRIILLPVTKIEQFMRILDEYNSSRSPSRVLHVQRVREVNRKRVIYESRRPGRPKAVEQQVTNTNLAEKAHAAQLQSESMAFVDDSVMIKPYYDGDLIYIVKDGDTFDEIARRYGISLEQLELWNGSYDELAIGQKLIIMRRISPGADQQLESSLTGNTS